MSHLTEGNRYYICDSLKAGKSFKAIALHLQVSHTTVKREVCKHAFDSDKGATGRRTNRCVKRETCHLQFVCDHCKSPLHHTYCAKCKDCNSSCPQYVEERCELLSKAPYVCNGCLKEPTCVLRKRYYDAGKAHKAYQETLVQSRKGFALTANEVNEMGTIIESGMHRKQSLHHIYASMPDAFNVCEKSLYTYINSGIFPKIRRSNLPVAASMKPRRKKGSIHLVHKNCADGRRWTDFQKYREANPDMAVVEMDTVMGERGGRVLLTMNFDNCGFMYACIRDNNTSQSVINVFNYLEDTLGLETFRRLFPVILTDNGSEFSNPAILETSHVTGERRTRIFFCEPYSAWQKPMVENNHLNLRNIFPKGESMQHVTQDDVTLALSHLNSMLRKAYGDIPAIVRFEQIYGREILPKLGISLIPPAQVSLTPDLHKKR